MQPATFLAHGVRSVEDLRLVEELATRAIPLDVSPVSNVATGVYASLEDHPFTRLREAGVVVTLNSDDPSMFGGWVDRVYVAARDSWDYGDDELAALSATAIDASFADDDVKRELRGKVDDWLASPGA